MNSKDYLTNKAFCPIPWTGLMYNFDGSIKNCIRSNDHIGNINKDSIETILKNDHVIKETMRSGEQFNRCQPCYDLELNRNSFDIISDRVFYLKEMRKVDPDLYKNNEFKLSKIDVRWSNLCNFACVYCGPEFSSKWQAELGINIQTPEEKNKTNFKNYIFDRVTDLKHVYLAGGEPLLMKENYELLLLLKEKNPEVNLRVNTNLSKVDTNIFELITTFQNVHWIVSVETIQEEYEYIRYSGVWDDFLDNLQCISKIENHKITFNMLHFVLNFKSIFNCVDFLKGLNFHNNAFVIGPITGPDYLDIRNLPSTALEEIKEILIYRINQKPGYMLENSYSIMLNHINKPFSKNLPATVNFLSQVDNRRKLNSKEIFQNFYKWIN